MSIDFQGPRSCPWISKDLTLNVSGDKLSEHQLKAAIQDMNSMKSQSESLAKEYDRLDGDEKLY